MKTRPALNTESHRAWLRGKRLQSPKFTRLRGVRPAHSCPHLFGCGCLSAQLEPCRARSVTCDGNQPGSPGAVGTKDMPRRHEGRGGGLPGVSRTDTRHPLGGPEVLPCGMPPEFQVAGAGPWTHVNEVVGVGVLLGGEVVQVGQVLVLGDKGERAAEAGGLAGRLTTGESVTCHRGGPSQLSLSARVYTWALPTRPTDSYSRGFMASSCLHWVLRSLVQCVLIHHALTLPSTLHSLAS